MTRQDLLDEIKNGGIAEEDQLTLPEDLLDDFAGSHSGRVIVTAVMSSGRSNGLCISFMCTDKDCTDGLTIECDEFASRYWVI